MATGSSVEDRVSVFIEDILKVEEIRESFNVFLVSLTYVIPVTLTLKQNMSVFLHK